MIAFTWFGSIALIAAFGVLVRALLIRYPIEEDTHAGDWAAPDPAQRISPPERGFDHSVIRVEVARSEPAEWQGLLAHLDQIADAVDPRPTSGQRPVLVHRTGRKFWEQVDKNGVPVNFNADYLARRLAHIERTVNPSESRSTK